MTTMARGLADALHWWRAPGALERFLADLIDSEARGLRPGGPWPPRLDPTSIALVSADETGLGFDSLERLGLAAALSQALHLHDGGLEDDLLTSPTLAGWLQASALALECCSERITVRSSGSTGKPRSHTHPTKQLAREAETWARLLTGRRRVRAAVASHHIYGLLFALMLPAELAAPLEDLRGQSPGSILATLRPGDLVIGHPLFWSALLCASPSGWPSDVVGVTSGAACPESVAVGTTDAGLSRLLDIYGASETAGLGWRERTGQGWKDAGGAFRLAPWWRRGGADTLGRRDEAPLVAPDRLTWDRSGGFRIEDRRDGTVKVGAVTVDLGRVRQAICAHPGVADAVVRPMRPGEGLRLKAFVVPRPGAGDDLASLLTSLAARLETTLSVAERPRAFRFGRSLPLTASGKPADWPARDAADAETASG